MTKETDPIQDGNTELPPFEFKTFTQKDAPLVQLFGNNAMNKISNLVISMPDSDFTISKLARLTNTSRQTISPAVKTLLRFKILKTVRHGRRIFYKYDEDSEQGKRLRKLLRTIIDVIIDESDEYDRTHKPPQEFEVTEHDLKLIIAGDYKGDIPEGCVLKLKPPE